MKLTLNDPTGRFVQASAPRLALQGLQIFYSSCWGPLRTSAAQRAKYRAESKFWLFESVKLWAQEFGMNAAVGVLMATLMTVLGANVPLALLVGVALPPVLVMVQMFVDASRLDTLVLCDRETASGLTVRLTPEHNWTFFNHFGLPIGARHGRAIRDFVHEGAKLEAQLLSCYAQNEPIAVYYLHERENGVRVESKRPLLYWDYSNGVRRRETNANPSLFRRLLGVDNDRNVGQLPLRRATHFETC